MKTTKNRTSGPRSSAALSQGLILRGSVKARLLLSFGGAILRRKRSRRKRRLVQTDGCQNGAAGHTSVAATQLLRQNGMAGVVGKVGAVLTVLPHGQAQRGPAVPLGNPLGRQHDVAIVDDLAAIFTSPDGHPALWSITHQNDRHPILDRAARCQLDPVTLFALA